MLLNDALYSLNRYEELIIGVNCGSWKAPEETRRICAQEIRSIGKNVDTAKIALTRSMKTHSPSNVDLLDIYSELEETTGHLGDLGNNVSNYQGEDGIAFAEAADKTLVLGAKLYAQLRQRLLLQEQRCEVK